MFFELKKKPKDLVHSLESHQDRALVFFFPKVLYLFHKVTIKLQLSAEEILNLFPVLSPFLLTVTLVGRRRLAAEASCWLRGFACSVSWRASHLG